MLWDNIKADIQTMVKLDGQHELQTMVLCNIQSHLSVTEWISAQDTVMGDFW